MKFDQFLKEQQSKDNKWVSTCANFLEISYDFLEVVTAYRVRDAIPIEHGCQKYSLVWQAMGQHKYVEIFFARQESMFCGSPFLVLQEIRRSVVVRRYHGSTGK